MDEVDPYVAELEALNHLKRLAEFFHEAEHRVGNEFPGRIGSARLVSLRTW